MHCDKEVTLVVNTWVMSNTCCIVMEWTGQKGFWNIRYGSGLFKGLWLKLLLGGRCSGPWGCWVERICVVIV